MMDVTLDGTMTQWIITLLKISSLYVIIRAVGFLAAMAVEFYNVFNTRHQTALLNENLAKLAEAQAQAQPGTVYRDTNRTQH